MPTYLPKVQLLVTEFGKFWDKVEMRFNKCEGGLAKAGGQVDEERIKNIEFLANTNKAELDFQKKLFNNKLI